MTDACARGDERSLRQQVLRYGILGLANTAVGYAIILGLHAKGVPLVLANLGGYAAGLAMSFLGNRSWTFGTSRSLRAEFALYAVVVAVSFLLNLGVVHLLVGMGLGVPAAQAAGVATYSTIMFLGLRHVVFATLR